MLLHQTPKNRACRAGIFSAAPDPAWLALTHSAWFGLQAHRQEIDGLLQTERRIMLRNNKKLLCHDSFKLRALLLSAE
jgi:hypothetical protein